jgi:hypothetical protein
MANVIVGWFHYDCQPDGLCAYGCGKRPDTICDDCVQQEKWLDGEMPDNLHPLMSDDDGQITDECDWCGEFF